MDPLLDDPRERGGHFALDPWEPPQRVIIGGRLTPPGARIYCAPSHLKRVFRDFSFIDGVQKRAILGSSPEAFVASAYSLKIRIGNLCGDSRRSAFSAIR